MSNMYDEGGRGTDLRDQFRQEYTTQQSAMERKRRSKSTWLIGGVVGVLLLLLILGGSACGTYNSLTTEREQVRAAFSNVDVQLQRRADLIPNLVNTVKGYAKHEEAVFSEIAQARSRLLGAQTVEEKSAANDQLSGALGRLLVLTENYPNLKADQQFLRLQDELAGTENRIGVARRDYNQEVVDYNTKRQRFPTVIMANLLGFDRAEEFKAEAGAREVPKVDFNK
jgi:LemA protein